MTQLRKTVDLTDHDDEQQLARGALLVPNRIDSQGDWFSPETVREVAHGYMRRLQAGEATLKLMHAVDAGEKLSLVENRILEHAEPIGETEHVAGTWVVAVKAHDEAVWQAFKQGVLGGFSIGGDSVEGVEQSPGEVPDSVTRSAEYPDDAPVQRIDSVRINEFSGVDQPAVKPAKVEVLKSQKEHGDAMQEGGEACRQALIERGHSEDDADLLCRAMHKEEAEKPIVLPNGAEFDDFDRCVAEISGDGTTREEAERICGSGREQSKATVNGTGIDLTPPQSMVNAAEAAADAGEQRLIPGSCGTGVGDRRRDQIRSGELSPETTREIASYLVSHEEDVTAGGSPTQWSDDEWGDCGNAQYAKWGGTGGGEPREWAMRRVNDIDSARDDDPTYSELTNMTRMTKESVGDWVSWPRAAGDTRGRIVEIIDDPGEGFSDAISGDVTVEAEEDNPVALLEVWDGFGEDATAREDEAGRGETMHVANRFDRLTVVTDPREREAAADDGLLSRIKAGLGFGNSDDAGDSVEAPAEKVGRTLSQANVSETKAVHDAAARMLAREGVGEHDKAATYSEDENDGFALSEHYKAADLNMMSKLGIPMPDDALLLYPNTGQAEAVAGDLGLAEESHAHTIEGVGEVYMPGRSMSLYREAVSDHGPSRGGPMDSPGMGDEGMTEQGRHSDETEMATDEPAESGADPDDNDSDKMTDEDSDTDATTEKLNELLETVEGLAEKVDENAERIDRVAASKADSDQATGTEKTTEDTSDAETFIAGLTGGR